MFGDPCNCEQSIQLLGLLKLACRDADGVCKFCDAESGDTHSDSCSVREADEFSKGYHTEEFTDDAETE